MTDKKLQNNNIILGNKSGYCSKCLRELDGDRVVDHEGNEFCDNYCKIDFWREHRKEIESLVKELR
jgi:hypothetical protein